MVMDMKLVWNVLKLFVAQGIVAVLILFYLYVDFMYVVDPNYVHV
jgi:hypothetical protein